MEFQSLFFWIWNSDYHLDFMKFQNIEFQSLFFWIWNSDFYFDVCICGWKKFQSLFFWIWNSDLVVYLFMGAGGFVSILVFLDMEFRPFVGGGIWVITSCFNPCFSGYGIQTIRQLSNKGKGWMFQSLFFWIWNSDARSSQVLPVDISFNPCFSGYGIQTRVFFNILHDIWKFQSLFFWIWNSDTSTRTKLVAFINVSILVFLDMEFRLSD